MLPVRLSILIPLFNEAHSIGSVLQRVATVSATFFRENHIEVTLIVVDDGSKDQSAEKVRAFSLEHPEVALKLITHDVNAGKGAAVRTALGHADGDICLIQDADFEYDPAEYPKLLAPLLLDEADVVLGSRFLNTVQRRPLSFWQAVANRAITSFAGMAAGLDLSDVETGYKAFRTSLGKTVPLRSSRFGLDPELIIQFSKRHARVMEVPITYRGRTREQGKKIGAGDLLSAFFSIFRTWVMSARHTDAAGDMLVAISQAKRFNRWMADTIRSCIKGDVLELGAGIGNLTVLLSAGGNSYVATDTEADHISELRSRTAYQSNVKAGFFDLTNSADAVQYKQSADTVVCLNVLEHVEDDMNGLANIHSCLRPGGTAIVLVPQSPNLFGSLDEVLEHKRRYTREELSVKMLQNGFELKRMIEFNHATWPGWYLNSRVLRRKTLSRFQLRCFDLLVPLWRLIDKLLPWPSTSLIAIGVKGDAPK